MLLNCFNECSMIVNELEDVSSIKEKNNISINNLKDEIFIDRTKDPLVNELEYVNLPPNFWIVENEISEIFFENIISDFESVSLVNGNNILDKYKPIVIDSKSSQNKITFISKDKEENLNNYTMKILNTGIKTKDKTVLFIGDSTINEGMITKKLIENYNLEESTLKLVGTRGKNGNFHEGRGGWSIKTFRTNTKYEDVMNPFYDPQIKDFSIEYYGKNNDLSTLTDVIFQLGINDVFNLDSKNLQISINEILSDYEFLVQQVREYNPKLNIGIALTIPPNSDKQLFSEIYGNDYVYDEYKYKYFVWNNSLIDHFKEREDENIRLIPENLIINTETDHRDGVHLNKQGYEKIGDLIYYYLKHF